MKKIEKYFAVPKGLGIKNHIGLLRLGVRNYVEFARVQEYVVRTQDMLDGGERVHAENIISFLVVEPRVEEFSDIDRKARGWAIRTYMGDRTANGDDCYGLTMAVIIKDEYDGKRANYLGQLVAGEGDFFNECHGDIATYLALAHKKYNLSVDEQRLRIQEGYQKNLDQSVETLEKRVNNLVV
jgi:hypothetical protein